MTYSFSQNDVMSYIYQQIFNLFSSGSPTATVLSDIKQRADVNYTSTHGSIVLYCQSETPFPNAVCGDGVWIEGKNLHLILTVVAISRSVAYDIWSRLEDYLEVGKYQTTMAPGSTPSELMYSDYRGIRTLPTESELYGLQAEVDVLFYRV